MLNTTSVPDGVPPLVVPAAYAGTVDDVDRVAVPSVDTEVFSLRLGSNGSVTFFRPFGYTFVTFDRRTIRLGRKANDDLADCAFVHMHRAENVMPTFGRTLRSRSGRTVVCQGRR